MGIYVNPDNEAFRQAVIDDIYIDKTEMIAHMNRRLNKVRVKYVCVSRPRRFGRSMAADMLSAYYSRGCDSRDIFSGKKITANETYAAHLNQHNVIRLDVQRFLFSESHFDIFTDQIQEKVIRELKAVYKDCFEAGAYGLPDVLEQIHGCTGDSFIFIIDEWDCVFRIAKEHKAVQKNIWIFSEGSLKGLNMWNLPI